MIRWAVISPFALPEPDMTVASNVASSPLFTSLNSGFLMEVQPFGAFKSSLPLTFEAFALIIS